MKANIITNIKKFRLFDVSLRDGLQSQKKIYSLDEKISMFDNIIKKYNPTSIEIGSFVNKKILPQMANTYELFNYIQKQNLPNDIYVLTPNLTSVKTGINVGVENYSFITSVSNSFQWKNINKSLNNTKNEINLMHDELKKANINNKIKIYLSCVDECPIEGKQQVDHIVKEFLYYYKRFNIHDICISDTCGTLKCDTLKLILDRLIDIHGVSPSKISLHFHFNNNNSDDVINLFHMLNIAKRNHILNLDISDMNNGGCSMTIDEKNLKNNMSYDILYQYNIVHG